MLMVYLQMDGEIRMQAPLVLLKGWNPIKPPRDSGVTPYVDRDLKVRNWLGSEAQQLIETAFQWRQQSARDLKVRLLIGRADTNPPFVVCGLNFTLKAAAFSYLLGLLHMQTWFEQQDLPEVTDTENASPPPDDSEDWLGLSGEDYEESEEEAAEWDGAEPNIANSMDISPPRRDLSHQNLAGADLRGANLTGADLRGANLYGVIYGNTTMPNGRKADDADGAVYAFYQYYAEEAEYAEEADEADA